MPRSLAPLLLLALAPLAAAGEPPFVHVQLDRPLVRLGDRVRWRVHREGLEPVSLQLLGPAGQVLGEAQATGRAPEGSFALDPQGPGGEHRLVARCAGVVVHQVPLEVYDLAERRLDLSLRVLSDVVYPGGPLVAAFRARALDGTPLGGVVGKARASFGGVIVEAPFGPTDPEGGAVLRLTVPASVSLAGGHLAAAVELRREKIVEAVARPVRASCGVSSLEAFVEGGAVVPGAPHALALLVRDLDGRPCAVEGWVEDDRGAFVEVFQSDARGLALVTVPYARERSYSARIDRPAGVETIFPLPGPGGQDRAVRLERGPNGALRVRVHGRPGKAWAQLARAGAAPSPAGARARVELRVPDEGEADAELGLPGEEHALAHVLVGEGERVTHVIPVWTGARWPVEVSLTASAAAPGPREQVVIDVRARRVDGPPVSGALALSVAQAGLFAATEGELEALPVRALLHRHLVGAGDDLGDLARAEDEDTWARRRALMLVRAARAVPPGGVALEAALRVLAAASDEPALPRRLPVAVAPRPAVVESTRTEERAGALELALRRAHYVRQAAPRGPAGVLTLEPLSPRLAAAPARGAGLPQEQLPPPGRVDQRDVLAWAPVVQLNELGQGRLTLRTGDELGALQVVVQGLAGGAPAVAEARLAPRAPFAARLDAPAYLRLGDRVEAELRVSGDGDEPIRVRIEVPAGVRLIGPSEVLHRPATSPAALRLQLEALAPGVGEVRVVAVRGALRAVHRTPLEVGALGVERAVACSTGGPGTLELPALSIPASALPGSVVARARVTSSAAAAALTGLEAMLREPYGCFEQTTSVNAPNLAVLEALLETGADSAVLERAWALAEQGQARILTFQTRGGGFRLWPHAGEPQARYTALAVWQLSRWARLSQGRGRKQLRQAVAWLEERELHGAEAALVALATLEAELPWAGVRRALAEAPRDPAHLALLCDAASAWRGPGGPRDLEALVADLAGLQRQDGSLPSGEGLFGGWGRELEVVSTAHAAVAFQAMGRLDAARRARAALAARRDPQGGWGGTVATVQALRALTRLEARFGAERPAPVPVVLAAASGTPLAGRLPGASPRPLRLDLPLEVAPGARVSATLTIGATPAPVEATLACSWLEVAPASAPDAPYRLATSLPGVVPLGERVQLRVRLERRGPVRGGGQVVARIGLPGGCELVTGDDWRTGVDQWEVREGQLVLYWERPPADTELSIPLLARVTGSYATGPSEVGPYYERDQGACAPSLALRVIAPVDPLQAARALGR